nr:gamma-butyrobetaine dioxygenase-like [Lytechinus pictus]
MPKNKTKRGKKSPVLSVSSDQGGDSPAPQSEHSDAASDETPKQQKEKSQIQMLHCLQQSDQGGENIIVDGFKVANDLRETSPDSYDILTKQVLEFYDRGTDSLGEFFNISRNHVIRLNEKNEVAQITFTEHGRSAIARMHADDVINTYKALMAFIDLLYAQENVFEYKMENVGDSSTDTDSMTWEDAQTDEDIPKEDALPLTQGPSPKAKL